MECEAALRSYSGDGSSPGGLTLAKHHRLGCFQLFTAPRTTWPRNCYLVEATVRRHVQRRMVCEEAFRVAVAVAQVAEKREAARCGGLALGRTWGKIRRGAGARRAPQYFVVGSQRH